MTDTTGPPRPGERIELAAGGVILVDRLGAVAIRTQPTDQAEQPELALMLELGGRLNKRHDRGLTAYLFRTGQAAELIANIVVAVQSLAAHGDPDARDFSAEFERALRREQERLGAVESEHG